MAVPESPKQYINLTKEKRALLQALLREEGLEQVGLITIVPDRMDGPLPVSFAQQRLWFIE